MPKSLVPHKNTGHGLTHSPLKAKLVEAKSRDVSALGKNISFNFNTSMYSIKIHSSSVYLNITS